MPRARKPRVAPSQCALACLLLSRVTPAELAAQSVVGTSAPHSAPSTAQAPTLQSLDQSLRTQSFTAVQLRRFVDDRGTVTAVREKLEVASNGTSDPAFALTFLGVEGEPTGSPLSRQWQQTYAEQGPRFYTHGTFRVRDLARAATNYSLYDFGSAVRANRAVRRTVVFPHSFDKALLVVDVDSQTGVPLYIAEFDTHLRMLSEVEAISFSSSVGSFTPTTTGATRVANYSAALSLMGQPAETVDPNVASVAAEYQLDRVEVENDAVNGQWRMTMTYTDGIDQFFVVETPKSPDWMATLPARSGGSHVIGRFRDAAMSMLVFWEGGVSFHVAGRGSLQRLDNMAQAIYLQAISTH